MLTNTRWPCNNHNFHSPLLTCCVGVASPVPTRRGSPDVPVQEDHAHTPHHCLPSRWLTTCTVYLCVRVRTWGTTCTVYLCVRVRTWGTTCTVYLCVYTCTWTCYLCVCVYVQLYMGKPLIWFERLYSCRINHWKLILLHFCYLVTMDICDVVSCFSSCPVLWCYHVWALPRDCLHWLRPPQQTRLPLRHHRENSETIVT